MIIIILFIIVIIMVILITIIIFIIIGLLEYGSFHTTMMCKFCMSRQQENARRGKKKERKGVGRK